MPATATREIFWQISWPWAFYALSLVTLAILSWGIYRAFRFIRQGAHPVPPPVRRLGVRKAAADILSQRVLAGEGASRWWHMCVFYGFVVLFLVTCWVMLAHYGHRALFEGTPYLVVTLAADLAGAAVILGILVALFTNRRDASPARDRTLGKAAALSLLGIVCLTGFLTEGLRIHVQGDPWRMWSPVGAAASRLFAGLGPSAGPRLYRGFWWLHGVLALGFLAWIPLSARLRHLLFLPLRRAATPLEPRSAAPLLELQSLRTDQPPAGSVRLGIEGPGDTTRDQRLGLLACMECGRCEGLCPAFQTGQPLTPRKFLQDLRQHALGRGHTSNVSALRASGAVGTASLWACRLCRACEELCPAGIEHVPQMIEIRRAEVLGRGSLPEDGAVALRNLTRTANPYGAAPSERVSWIRAQRASDPTAQEEALVLWTGCFQPGDEHKTRVLSCLTGLLRKCGVPFFIPEDTSCCGDPARILGEEDLFQTLAKEQIRRIEASGSARVLVHCPHCYTVLKDIYPLLGARFSVVHTSRLIQGLIQEKKLEVRGFPNPLPVVYHDPCFLSRYQELAEPPRTIMGSVPGLVVKDPPRTRREGFCCGAGGGHFFMDLDLQERPSSQRLEEMLAQGAQVLTVSCGFCFSMFDDALRRLADPPPLRIADWLELLEEGTGNQGG